jgi:crotonobetainyl-CoA:carnitine CoA-transferase CaiB-like acyl-CoA transferase
MLKIRVLDLSRALAGPLAAMTLADLGAHVIKVERPGRGDDTRGWGPPFHEGGLSAYFLSVNRNKLSLALDLGDPRDRATLLDLLATADVLIENFRPGALERLGLDVQELLTRYPTLVWCTISGFGPDVERSGYDLVVQAESGWMSITGQPEGPPIKSGVAITDILAGKDAAIGVLATLLQREHGPLPAERRRLSVSLFHSAVAALVNVAQNVLVTGSDARRWGNAHPSLVPYQLFETADEAMVIAVGSDVQWRGLCNALELEDLGADPDLATNAGRVAQRERVVAAIAERLRKHGAEHWMAKLQAAAVPAGVVRSVGAALKRVPSSRLLGVAPPWGTGVRYPPPRLNEHGDLIRKFGWSAFDHLIPLRGDGRG